jgi:hypothetical protein
LHQQPQAWNRLKEAMRDRFVPISYKRDLRKKVQHLEQENMSVQEYFAELHKGMIGCGIEEDPEDKVCESPSLVLVINDTKLLMPCVKSFELGISNTCDEGVCGKEWWPQDHKEIVHGYEMMIMVEMHIIW